MKYSMEKLGVFLDEVFNCYDFEMPRKGNIEDMILEILVGTQGTTRLGAYPSAKTVEEIRKRIRHNMAQSLPMEISSAWGAIKTVPTDHRTIDIAELFAIRQYQAMADRVKKIYKPGLIFNIYMGDSYYEYLYGYDSRIDDYCNGFRELAQKHDALNVVSLKEKCKGISTEIDECRENYKLLEKYWSETSGIVQGDFNKVPSWQKLHDHGWIGDISFEMRDFYIKRMMGLYPEEGFDYWLDKVIRFFAYSLFINQHDLMERKNMETSTMDACLLRVPPPGLPRKLYSNRIRMRIAPKKIIKNSAPPWSVVGAISIGISGKFHARVLDGNAFNSIKDIAEKFKYNGIDVLFYEEVDVER